MSVHRAIAAYYGEAQGEHHRYRSWEHCYKYFRRARSGGLVRDREHAALQLGFYLASWGMYRGSSFLLQHAYTVHRGVIEVVAEARFDELWVADFGAKEADCHLVPRIRQLITAIREAYSPFAVANGSAPPTDTLITKVILGTFGCLPACDRYFLDGLRSEGFKHSHLTDGLVGRLLEFCQGQLRELQTEQIRIERKGGTRYPLMKLVDMYFWQIGYERASRSSTATP